MNSQELTELTKTLVNNPKFDNLIDAYLEVAKDAVTSRLYPFDDSATFADVPVRLHRRTAEIACYLINKQGAEGETTHSENGVSRTYGSSGIPASYFVGIVPYCGNIK